MQRGCGWRPGRGSAFPGLAIPAKDAFEEGDGVGGEGAEEMFALLRGGEVGPSDVARVGTVAGGPGAVGGEEGVAGLDGLGGLVIADELGSDAEDHGGFPFAGMAHLVLVEVGTRLGWATTEVPVGGEEEEEVGALAVGLAEFEDGLAAWDIVAAMAIEEDDAPEAVLEEVLGEAVEEVEVGAGLGGKGAGEVEVMMGIAEPRERGEEHAVAELEPGAADDLAEEEAVGEERKMMTVLFQGGDGDDDGCGTGEGGDGRPRQIGEVHVDGASGRGVPGFKRHSGIWRGGGAV